MSAELGAVVLFDQNLYRTGHMANRWMHLLCEPLRGERQDRRAEAQR
jgi:hypothetical protein